MDISKIKIENKLLNIKDLTARELLDKTIYYFDTLNDLKNTTILKDGFLAITKGYYTINDGGGSLYYISENIIETPNDGDIVELQNNLFAVLIPLNNTVNIKQFGAIGDGETDNTEFIQNAIDYANDNHYKVFIPSADEFYAIGTGLIIKEHVAGVEAEKYDYVGQIRPMTEGITVLTIKPQVGFYMKNVTIGSDEKFTANGILFEGHVGLNIFEHCRVYNLNGFGMKFNAIYDSVLTDISVELCGNSDEYAFSFNDDDDTCNMTHIDRLQVEQADTKAIFISPNTLSCVFTDIHSERTTVVNNTNAWVFGGHSCEYNTIRLNALNINTITNCILYSGTNTTYNNVLQEEYLKALYEGINGNNIYFNNCDISNIEELQNQIGFIYFNNSNIDTIIVRYHTTCNFCKINNAVYDYSQEASKFYNCKINTITKNSQVTNIYLVNCTVETLESEILTSIYLENCVINELSNSSSLFLYTALTALNTKFNCDVGFDNVTIKMINSLIDGDLIYQAGTQLFEFINSRATGNVDSVYSSIPNITGEIGIKTENMNPSAEDYIGWVYTSSGWKGYGLISE